MQCGEPFSGGVAVASPLVVKLAVAFCLSQVGTFSTTIACIDTVELADNA